MSEEEFKRLAQSVVDRKRFADIDAFVAEARRAREAEAALRSTQAGVNMNWATDFAAAYARADKAEAALESTNGWAEAEAAGVVALRAEIALWKKRYEALGQLLDDRNAVLATEDAEIARLRALIEEAPHSSNCAVRCANPQLRTKRGMARGSSCDCFKSKAEVKK